MGENEYQYAQEANCTWHYQPCLCPGSLGSFPDTNTEGTRHWDTHAMHAAMFVQSFIGPSIHSCKHLFTMHSLVCTQMHSPAFPHSPTPLSTHGPLCTLIHAHTQRMCTEFQGLFSIGDLASHKLALLSGLAKIFKNQNKELKNCQVTCLPH